MKTGYKNISYLSIFIATAAALNVIEGLIPHPIIWSRLGLANLITLISIIMMGNRFAIKVTLGRVLLGSVILGTFMTPSFYLSLSGSIMACFFMILFYRPLGKISPLGISVIGAIVHNITQLSLAYVILVKHEGIIFLLPALMVSSVVAGMINGYIAIKIVPELAEFSFKKIYLVSGSPRRINILRKAGLPVIIVPPETKEDPPLEHEDPKEFSLRQARKKAESVFHSLSKPGCAIAADTVVEVDGKIFVKPADENQAAWMLRTLSEKIQKVHTALVIKNLNTDELKEMVETTHLKMKRLTEEEISFLKDKHLDKAGGYAIQGMNDKYIEWVKGSYTNVVGFPVEVLRRVLREIC
jgi:heptaprenyl diphosphate synthase